MPYTDRMDTRERALKTAVMGHWRAHRRVLPWRTRPTPYRVLVSEVMLQQTQVDRVVPKFRAFVRRFPSLRALADASPRDVLAAWQGLGYNRRALALHRAAQRVVRDHRGRLPRDPAALRALPGIGPYCAAAIASFAFNVPVPCIETNIRRVYLHHFFPRARRVSDARLLPLIEQTMDRANPRRWYAALMDYGSWLAAQVPNPNRRSRHYVKQPAFEGSDRQLRGRVVALLIERRRSTVPALASALGESRPRVTRVVTALAREGFLRIEKSRILLV